MGTSVAGGVVSVRSVACGEDHAVAEQCLEEALLAQEALLSPWVYGRNGCSLSEVVCGMLKERGLTFATAESCTGGWLASQMVDVPGASAVLAGGVVAYANEVKQNELDVPASVLREHGAVSEAVAADMARGVAERLRVDVALSTTGVAGPDGGTAEKPVGLVCFGLYLQGEVTTWSRQLVGDRSGIRLRACHAALQGLRLALLEEDVVARMGRSMPTSPAEPQA